MPARGPQATASPEHPPTAVTCRIGVRHVRRAFGPVVANDDVSLTVRPGTVHAVVGENGAGKSTLMRILYGLEHPDAGTVVMDDEPVRLRSANSGLHRGVGIVQQELALVPELTLLENLVLGAEPRRHGRVDWRLARQRADQLAASAGLHLEWEAQAAAVPVSIQQQLEILRLLYRGVDVLILDEPTAVLAPAQVSDLLRLLCELRTAGRTVLFISHKLDEVLAVADEVTVLRGGRSLGTLSVTEVDRAQLAHLVVGEHIAATDFVPSAVVGDPALVLEGLGARDDRGLPRLHDVSLTVRAGEILGVAGVAGNGQDELVETVIGLRRLHSGRVLLCAGGTGTDVTGWAVARRRTAGVAYVSADRRREGLAIEASLTDNVLAGFHRGAVMHAGWLQGSAVTRFVRDVLTGFSVQHDRTSDPARSLSGGNQQRLVMGREVSHRPLVLVANQPTRGVDIRGVAAIHTTLRQLRDAGAGILLVSEELDELQALSDRVVVLYRGKVSGELPGGAARHELGRLMLGQDVA